MNSGLGKCLNVCEKNYGLCVTATVDVWTSWINWVLCEPQANVSLFAGASGDNPWRLTDAEGMIWAEI